MAGDREQYQAHLEAGLSAAWDRDWPAAVAAFERALAEIADEVEPNLNLGFALAQLGRLDEALAVYERAHQLVPDDPVVLEKMAGILDDQGQAELAVARFLEAADAYLVQRDLHKAMRCWEQALRLRPDMTTVRAKLVRSYERLGDKPGAALEYLRLAHYFQRADEQDKASMAVQRALRLIPDHPEALQARQSLAAGGELPLPEAPVPAKPADEFQLAVSDSEQAKRDSAVDTADFGSLSSDEIMTWMETLAKRPFVEERAEKKAAEGAHDEPSPEPAAVDTAAPRPARGLDDAVRVPPAAPAPQPAAPPPPGSPAGTAGTDDQAVMFTAYYPKEVVLDVWQPLTAYAYRAMFAEQVTLDARKQLGPALGWMRRISERARQMIREGAMITAIPYLTGFQFNPPSVTIGFYENWHRFDFKLRAKETPLNQAVNGYLTFTIEGVIAADVPLAIFVGESTAADEVVSATQQHYQAVFCSYSHRDARIVERVERAYKALGMDYLRDVYALKSGQDWDDQLLRLIEQADIFQLFWSKTAAESPYVRKEWQHALELNREEVGFIRPVYWESPLPPVPPELGHIHFAFQPELAE